MRATYLLLSIFQVLTCEASPTTRHGMRSRRDTTYDYVIVGGGTAGLVIAERLSENLNVSVAVIEAGAFYEITDPFFSSVPAADTLWCGSSPYSTQPLIDWDFQTTNQAGANGRSIHFARGKCLGGTSARNFMIYQRGTVGSYQQWADMVGDQSYAWDNLLPYFKKSVHFTPPSSKRAANATANYNPDAFDPTSGPLDVSYANYASPFSSWIEGSFREMGIPEAQDFNSGSLMGSQYCSSTIQPSDESRESSQQAFYSKAVRGRPNLKVFHSTMAKQILFDAKKRAYGVIVTSNSTNLTIRANKEVIVSAGAFQSPQMLLVSGIGPAPLLQSLDIPVLSDLPGVGQNLIDHIFFGPTYRVNVETLTKLANNPAYILEQLAGPYATAQEGPLTNPVCDYLGWEKVNSTLRAAFSASTKADLATLPADWPEIEYLSGPGYIGNFSDLFTTQPKDGYQYATILAALVAPFSRGTVTITSKDTSDKPIVDPNWLASTTDQEVAVAAFKRARAAFQTEYMQPVLTDPNEYYPGTSEVQTDEQILQFVKNNLMTVWHPSGTCKMGNSTDSSAVVDSEARVFGVNGLRVIDASIFPLLPPGHPQSTVFAIAEKITALLQ